MFLGHHSQEGGAQGYDNGFLSGLSGLVPADGLCLSPNSRMAYGTGHFQPGSSEPLAIVLPETTEQVQAVVRHCDAFHVPVIPRGAGTNLVGAVTPICKSIMIATTRMKRILDFDETAGLVRVEAGVANQAVSEYLRSSGWRYAPDPSSRRTCTIGGNIATNSGGASCLKYGVTVNNLAGVTLVMPDGARVEATCDDLGGAGTDVAGLLCGSEGQIGLVTEALLRLVPCASETRSLMLTFRTRLQGIEAAHKILNSGVSPARFDFLERETVRLCEAHLSSGYPQDAGAVLLLDLEGRPAEIDNIQDELRHLARPFQMISADPDRDEQGQDLWAGRMKIYGAAAARGKHIMLDGVVPLSKVSDILGIIDTEAARNAVQVATTLHIGDGTVHSFLFAPPDAPDPSSVAERCATAIRLACIGLGGSLSAEYGVGLLHPDLLAQQFSSVDLAVQQRCITALRVDAVFNPGKVFPECRKATV